MTKLTQKAKRTYRAAGWAFDRVVGARIRERRQAAQLSQDALGTKVGKTFSDISKYEKGQHSIEPYLLARMALALECKPSDLIDGIEVGK